MLPLREIVQLLSSIASFRKNRQDRNDFQQLKQSTQDIRQKLDEQGSKSYMLHTAITLFGALYVIALMYGVEEKYLRTPQTYLLACTGAVYLDLKRDKAKKAQSGHIVSK